MNERLNSIHLSEAILGNMDKWTVQERCVAEVIIEMFEKRDPTGSMAFEPKHIYDGCYERLKEKWIPKPSLSASRQRAVVHIFTVLLARGELVQPGGEYTPYYLAEDGGLYYELKVRVANKKLKPLEN